MLLGNDRNGFALGFRPKIYCCAKKITCFVLVGTNYKLLWLQWRRRLRTNCGVKYSTSLSDPLSSVLNELIGRGIVHRYS